MRSLICLSVCLVALLGCASPKPVAPTAAPAVAAKETDDQKAQRLINYSVESGEPINTADGKKIICKQESVTNTRLKNKKICLTQDEWTARTNNAKDGFKEALNSSEALPPRGN
ncbi:hypothetical protein [Peristeroidobacter soli]|jgi:hypothetical protein|uniref:hypothetical protein n=1 Tax=Peristeroidobacter soli TaxID=2497877 RepID=UPI00101B6CDC|nr:hypothetical protein [Peristeroidobacter soli]